MLFKILVSLLSVLHAVLLVALAGGLEFGVGLGEMSAQKVAPLSVGLMGIAGVCFLLTISVYFLPTWSSFGLMFVMGGIGTLALWQFIANGAKTPMTLGIFLVEIALAGVPFMLLQRVD